MLCEKCSSIHFKRIEECELIVKEPERLAMRKHDDWDLTGNLFYIHSKDRECLEKTAIEGCHFCAMLQFCLFQCTDLVEDPALIFAHDEIVLRRCPSETWIGRDAQAWHENDSITIRFRNKRVTAMCKPQYPDVVCSMLAALTTSVNSKTSEQKQSYISKDLIAGQPSKVYSHHSDKSTTSSASLALASTWIRNCVKYHVPCIKTQGTFPTRIINVSNPERPYIEDGKCRSGEYVTLSYKWGEGGRYTSSEENIEGHYTSIPRTQLPRTFCEAIDITRGLGFQWLWIDALCILQDSPLDQSNEITRMGVTFRSSALTLFACSADSADTGLSSSRDPRWVKPCKLTLRASFNQHHFRGSTYVSVNRLERPSAPLFDRGWVLQEEVLAWRSLFFNHREISWKCRCDYSAESEPQYRGRFEPPATLNDYRQMNYDDPFGMLCLWLQKTYKTNDRERNNPFDEWYKLVTRYVSRSLTYQTDVLNALAGIANAMARAQDFHYGNGLWKEDLGVGLLWYIPRSDSHIDKNLSASGLNPVAPSWSWISQWGKPIEFWSWNYYESKILCKVVEFHDPDEYYNDIRTLFDMTENQETQLATNDLFNTVTKMSVALQGYLTRALVSSKYSGQDRKAIEARENGRWIQNVLAPDTGEVIGHIVLDSPPETVPIHDVFCFVCAERAPYGYPELTCLALHVTNRALSEYTRVGLVHTMSDGAFKDGKNRHFGWRSRWMAHGVKSIIRLV